MKQVAVGILHRDGLVLACQRKKTALYPLQWEFPGGKVESGESPTDALIRELHEELGIVARPAKEFHRQEWDYGDMAYRVFYYRSTNSAESRKTGHLRRSDGSNQRNSWG